MNSSKCLFRMDEKEYWSKKEQTLRNEQRAGLTMPNKYMLDNGSWVLESMCSLSLIDFNGSALQVCEKHHKDGCSKCCDLVRAGTIVRTRKVVPMSDLWRNSVDKPYESDKARRFFLQAPLCLLTIGSPESGLAQTVVCEKSSKELYSVVYASVEEARSKKEEINHEQLLKDLCSIAGSGAEKELIKFTAAAITNGSRRNVQKNLGISLGRKDSRRKNVHAAIEANKINEKISNDLMLVEIEAKIGFVPDFLKNLNNEGQSEESSEEEDDDDEEDEETHIETTTDEAITAGDQPPVITDQQLYDAWKEGSLCDLLPSQEQEIDSAAEESEEEDSQAEVQEVVEKVLGKWRRRKQVARAKMRILRRKTTKERKSIVTRHPDIGEYFSLLGNL